MVLQDVKKRYGVASFREVEWRNLEVLCNSILFRGLDIQWPSLHVADGHSSQVCGFISAPTSSFSHCYFQPVCSYIHPLCSYIQPLGSYVQPYSPTSHLSNFYFQPISSYIQSLCSYTLLLHYAPISSLSDFFIKPFLLQYTVFLTSTCSPSAPASSLSYSYIQPSYSYIQPLTPPTSSLSHSSYIQTTLVFPAASSWAQLARATVTWKPPQVKTIFHY